VLPVRFWHCAQWHIETVAGSPAASTVTAPQAQEPEWIMSWPFPAAEILASLA